MSLSGIQLVTFDVTNTLLKFRIPPWEYYALIAKQHGYNGSGKDVKNKMLNSYKVMSNQYPNFGKDTISWQQWWTRVIELTFQGEFSVDNKINVISGQLIEDYKTSTCWQITEGTKDIISLLKQYSITIGVISNFDPRLHEILFNLNIKEFFDFILTSYEIGSSKPDKSIFKVAQEKSKKPLDSSHCLHIGDDFDNDYQGAKMAGWQAILVTNKLLVKEQAVMNNVYPNLRVLCETIKKNMNHIS